MSSTPFSNKTGGKGKVAVIGAGGVAGLSAIKQFVDDGFEVLGLEASDGVGGVWRHSNYFGLSTNNPWPTYHFSELPMKEPPNSDTEYISGKHVQAYLEKYTDTYALNKHIRLNRRVVSVERTKDNGGGAHSVNKTRRWTVTHTDPKKGSPETVLVDFVYVATGQYSQANLPDLSALDGSSNAPPMLHSSLVRSEDQLNGRRVLVYGGGKSSVDMIRTCARVNENDEPVLRPTLCCRDVPNTVPRKIMGGNVGMEYVLFCPALDVMVLPWPNGPSQPQLARWFLQDTGLGRALVRSLQSTISNDCRDSFKLSDGSYPAMCRPEGTNIFASANVLCSQPPGFTEDAKKDAWDIKKGAIKSFGPTDGQVNFSDGSSGVFDLIVACTGYKVDYPFLSEEMCTDLHVPTPLASDSKNDGHPHQVHRKYRLWRNSVPLSDPTICFANATFVLMTTAYCEIQAMYVSDLWRGKLPEISACAKDQDLRKSMMKIIEEEVFLRRNCVEHGRGEMGIWSTTTTNLIKDMLYDMRINYPSKRHFLSEWWTAWGMDRQATYRDYRRIRDEAEAAGKKFRPGRFYLSFSGLLMLIAAGVAAGTYLPPFFS